jgi:hypothetical protein
MTESREELERTLLGDPFNREARARYAEWLLAAGGASPGAHALR